MLRAPRDYSEANGYRISHRTNAVTVYRFSFGQHAIGKLSPHSPLVFAQTAVEISLMALLASRLRQHSSGDDMKRFMNDSGFSHALPQAAAARRCTIATKQAYYHDPHVEPLSHRLRSAARGLPPRELSDPCSTCVRTRRCFYAALRCSSVATRSGGRRDRHRPHAGTGNALVLRQGTER